MATNAMGFRASVPGQIKAILEAQKNKWVYGNLNDGALNSTNIEIFAHGDINFNTRSALYISYYNKRETRTDDNLYFTFNIFYHEAIQKFENWETIANQRIDDIDRILRGFIPDGAMDIEALNDDRFRMTIGKEKKREFLCSMFIITYRVNRMNTYTFLTT